MRDSFASNYAWIVVSQVVSTAANFALTILISRHFGVEQFGVFVYAFAVAELFYVGAEFGFPNVLVSEAPHYQYGGEFFRAVLLLQAAFVGLATAAVVGFAHSYSGSKADQRMLEGIGMYVLAQAPARTLRAVFRSFERTRYEAATTAIEKLGVLMFAAIAVAAGVPLSSLALGLGISGILNVALLYAVCSRSFLPRSSRTCSASLCRTVLAAALPLGISCLFTIVNYRIGTVLLEHMRGNFEVGLFGAAQRLVTPLAYVTLTLQAAVLPWCVRSVQDDRPGTQVVVVSLLRWSVIAGIGFLVAFHVLGPSVVRVIFGNSYLAAVPVLRVLVISVPLTFAINISSLSLFLMRRYHSLTAAWAISSCIAVVASWLLVSARGAAGVGYAVIASEATLLLATLWLGRKFIGAREALLVAVGSISACGFAAFAPGGWSTAAMAIVLALLLPKNTRQLVRTLNFRGSRAQIVQGSPVEI